MQSRRVNILLTAIGGDIGQSVAQVLRRFDRVGAILGTDISDDHPGSFFVDQCSRIPRANDPEFIPELARIVKEKRIDFVIPISEPEIKMLYEAKCAGDWNAVPLVIPQGNALPTCLDKLTTVQYLRERGIATPWAHIAGNGAPSSMPCILKDRWSWGSKSIIMIEDHAMAEYYASRRPQSIFQELLLPHDEEYTCGVYRTAQGKTATVILRRSLVGGYTGKAIVVNDAAIAQYCVRIADALALRGSVNVQLRKTERGPMLFEINPRFSSTVLFRELIGFRDVLWSLQELLGEEPDLSFSPPVGTRIYRTSSERIIPPANPV